MCSVSNHFCSVISGPHDSDGWIGLQAELDGTTSPGQERLVAPFQLYSDETLLDNKGAKLHPLVFSLMNIATSVRLVKGIRCLPDC
jgi:hypothetical protein